MFTQPCLIRNNTEELREKLIKLGYKLAAKPYMEERARGILCRPKFAIGIPEDCYEFNLDKYLEGNPKIVDCGTNEELFLAIAALQDDTDKYQWFRIVGDNGIKWIKSVEENFTYDAAHNVWSKATVKELIKHFK